MEGDWPEGSAKFALSFLGRRTRWARLGPSRSAEPRGRSSGRQDIMFCVAPVGTVGGWTKVVRPGARTYVHSEEGRGGIVKGERLSKGLIVDSKGWVKVRKGEVPVSWHSEAKEV